MGNGWAGMIRAGVIRGGATALAFGLTGSLLVYSNSPGSQIYATRTGEIQHVKFSDGTQAYLNTRTRLEWFGDAEDRLVILHGGEAFFEVAPDPTRPFRVKAARGEIHVLGTRFNTYKKVNGHVVVTVLEGSVSVEGHESGKAHTAWQRQLYANQHLEYGSAGLVEDVCTSPTAPLAVKWREGMLQFVDDPLLHVVEELQRYTDRRIIVEHDERLDQLRLIGAVRTGNVQAALARLERLAPVSVIEHGDTFTLTYRGLKRENANESQP